VAPAARKRYKSLAKDGYDPLEKCRLQHDRQPARKIHGHDPPNYKRALGAHCGRDDFVRTLAATTNYPMQDIGAGMRVIH